MCQIVALRRVEREDLSRTPLRASAGRVRSYSDILNYRLADPATRWSNVTVPALLLLGRSARTAGFLDARTSRELEELVDGNSAHAEGPHHKENRSSAEHALVTVPGPWRTGRPLRSVGFLGRELSRELENVSVEPTPATARKCSAFAQMLHHLGSRT